MTTEKRNFVITSCNGRKHESDCYFTGRTPKIAALKAVRTLFKGRRTSKVTFCIRETTLGSKKKAYCYRAIKDSVSKPEYILTSMPLPKAPKSGGGKRKAPDDDMLSNAIDAMEISDSSPIYKPTVYLSETLLNQNKTVYNDLFAISTTKHMFYIKTNIRDAQRHQESTEGFNILLIDNTEDREFCMMIYAAYERGGVYIYKGVEDFINVILPTAINNYKESLIKDEDTKRQCH